MEITSCLSNPLANEEDNVVGFMQREPQLKKETGNSFVCLDSL